MDTIDVMKARREQLRRARDEALAAGASPSQEILAEIVRLDEVIVIGEMAERQIKTKGA